MKTNIKQRIARARAAISRRVALLLCRIFGHKHNAAELALLHLKVSSNQHYFDTVSKCERCGHEDVIPGEGLRPVVSVTCTAGGGTTISWPPRETITA